MFEDDTTEAKCECLFCSAPADVVDTVSFAGLTCSSDKCDAVCKLTPIMYLSFPLTSTEETE